MLTRRAQQTKDGNSRNAMVGTVSRLIGGHWLVAEDALCACVARDNFVAVRPLAGRGAGAFPRVSFNLRTLAPSRSSRWLLQFVRVLRACIRPTARLFVRAERAQSGRRRELGLRGSDAPADRADRPIGRRQRLPEAWTPRALFVPSRIRARAHDVFILPRYFTNPTRSALSGRVMVPKWEVPLLCFSSSEMVSGEIRDARRVRLREPPRKAG